MPMSEATFKVEGMSCQHCVNRVQKALQGLTGIESLEVQIGLVQVSFDENKVRKEEIEKAIVGAGYKVV